MNGYNFFSGEWMRGFKQTVSPGAVLPKAACIEACKASARAWSALPESEKAAWCSRAATSREENLQAVVADIAREHASDILAFFRRNEEF